jgi:MinD superfamily P-loop ATPase
MGDINMPELPVIDEAKCDLCGLCVSACKCGILVIKDNKVKVVRTGKCSNCNNYCNACELVCPTGAISCPFEVVIEDDKK